MKIYFNGAAHDVTGSQFVLYVNGQSLMIDCGLYQGENAYERNVNFRFNPQKLDAVIFSHAHIDHSGNLPNLVKQGYRQPIFTTPPTAELTAIMLRDSAKIYQEDTEYLNRKKRKHGEPMVEPLYTFDDAEAVAELFQEVDSSGSRWGLSP